MSRPHYRVEPFSINRRMVAASTAVGREHNNIHAVVEVDITEPRCLMREHRQQTGETLSLTAFVIACLARAIAENPRLNAFRSGRNLVLLDDVTISTIVERESGGEKFPEPVAISAANAKSYREIHTAIRDAQSHLPDRLGGLSGVTWWRFIPGFLLRQFVRWASGDVGMNSRFGVIGVTAIGMHGGGALWLIPLSGATVTIAVGGIVDRLRLTGGQVEIREHLCLTATFNHDIVDGAPAARFLKRLSELLQGTALLEDAATPGPPG